MLNLSNRFGRRPFRNDDDDIKLLHFLEVPVASLLPPNYANRDNHVNAYLLYRDVVYSYEQLRLMPSGTLFRHSNCGPCQLESSSESLRMRFFAGNRLLRLDKPDKGKTLAHPFDAAMRLLYCSDANFDIPY